MREAIALNAIALKVLCVCGKSGVEPVRARFALPMKRKAIAIIDDVNIQLLNKDLKLFACLSHENCDRGNFKRKAIAT
ncbi:MAG: hypothetical protein AAGA60_09435 [Cyanobacteria bacterium P01_E01_bin.42]